MFKKYWNKTDGNISVIFALGISVILLGAGIAIDISLTHSAKSEMQDALDTAVLAAALNAEKKNYSSYGRRTYVNNVSVNRLKSTSVKFSKQNGNIVGIAKGSLPTYFAGILPKSALDIRVKSVANVSVKNSVPCIIALNQTASPSITVNGGTTLEGDGCEMHSHSQSSNALTANAGINVTLDKTCVAGDRVLDNSNGAIGRLETNCAVAPDPYAGQIPEPTSIACDFSNGNHNSASLTLQPGVYCGWHNFNNSNSQIEFEPGLYVIRNGGWNVNGGRWSGDDVTFYFFDNSDIRFNSGVEADMSAPTRGDYKDIFVTERPGTFSGRTFILNDNRGFDFTGAIHLPGRRIVMNGGSTVRGRQMKLIADTISFNNSYLSFEVDTDDITGAVVSPYLSE